MRFNKGYHPNIVRNNVLVCREDTPPIRYNSTKEEVVQKTDNVILTQSSEPDMKRLEEIVKKRITDSGPGRDFDPSFEENKLTKRFDNEKEK